MGVYHSLGHTPAIPRSFTFSSFLVCIPEREEPLSDPVLLSWVQSSVSVPAAKKNAFTS